MANIITLCRILCSVFLLLVPVFSQTFFGIYLLAGFTDMIDGTVARKMNTVSELGSKLDTIADFVFVIICLIKLLPALELPIFLLIWTGIIGMMKSLNVIVGLVIRREFVAVHSIMNKLTGALLFLLPLSLSFVDIRYSGCLICIVATFAAAWEGYLIGMKGE